MSEYSPSQHPGWKRPSLLGTLRTRAIVVGATALIVVTAAITALVSPGHRAPQANDIAATSRPLLGMSAPSNLWAQRVSEVGPGLQARRLFYTSFTASLSLATSACNSGMTPVISYKIPNNDWAGVGSGKYDSQLAALHVKLVALPCAVFVVLHHEPNGDGSSTAFTAMQVRGLPILGGSITDSEVKVGVIGNGFWYNSNNQGLSDAELDAWVGPSVRKVSDFIAADTYQLKAGVEDVGSKIRRMQAWGVRVNAKTPTSPVRALGLGEFNSQTAAGITDGLNALKTSSLFVPGFGCIWNTNLGTVTVLTGARLTAFKQGLATWNN